MHAQILFANIQLTVLLPGSDGGCHPAVHIQPILKVCVYICVGGVGRAGWRGWRGGQVRQVRRADRSGRSAVRVGQAGQAGWPGGSVGWAGGTTSPTKTYMFICRYKYMAKLCCSNTVILTRIPTM